MHMNQAYQAVLFTFLVQAIAIPSFFFQVTWCIQSSRCVIAQAMMVPWMVRWWPATMLLRHPVK